MEKLSPDLQRRINKIKLLFLTERNTVFWSTLLAGMWLKATTKIPTAATDGLTIFFNEEFCKRLTDAELKFLIIHETYHVAHDHVGRAKQLKLDPLLWNIAGDYMINLDLVAKGYQMPAEGLYDTAFKGWSAKQIYDYLKGNAQSVPSFFQCDLLDAPEDMESTEHQEAIKTNIVKAATQAKISGDPGSIPGNIQRIVEELLNPELPWNVILQNHLHTYNKDDYSWRRPNKKYMPDIYLPSLYGEALDLVTVGIDVSGSIGIEDLQRFMSEVRYIFDTLKPKSMRVMSFDTEVHTNQLLEQGDDWTDIQLIGGGGTHVGPLIDSIREEKPAFALIFSDGEFSKPYLDDIESDLFWILVGNSPVEFSKGEVIRFNE